MTDKNSKDSFHTVILHQDNLTHRADVCTLKACYIHICHQIEWLELSEKVSESRFM